MVNNENGIKQKFRQKNGRKDKKSGNQHQGGSANAKSKITFRVIPTFVARCLANWKTAGN